MNNHTNLDRPLYIMSVAVCNSCDFVVGKKTSRPKPNERSGKPITIKMESGDCVYFDGGGVLHEVTRIEAGTAEEFWEDMGPKGIARVSVLFRELMGRI